MSIVDRADGRDTTEKCGKNICEIGTYKGSAGHTMLVYPSGGKILTSMGHWIELMKLDTTKE